MNTTTIRRVVAAVAVLALAATAAACSSDDDSSGHDSNSAASEQARPADVNDADVVFVRRMIPHHRQAVAMSEMVIEAGTDSDTIALAEQIKAAQGPEIDQMTTWLDDWGVAADSIETEDHGMHGDVSSVDSSMMEGAGMMSNEEMDNMSAMSGADLESMFLQMMIRHHEGAIEMAQTELEDGSNGDVLALAQNIVDIQQAEIETMSSMLNAR